MKLYSILSKDQVYHLVLIYYLFLTLNISPIPIENVFVSSGLNLPFTKGITGTALGLFLIFLYNFWLILE